ncbi:caspase family protein [Streptomyces sp. YIM S03343]
MGKIYALLVGIDDYPVSVARSLSGCVNDITEVRRLLADLAGSSGEQVHVRELLNAEATVEAVAEAVSRQLGAAGAGDKALLWFSGHGTELPATGDDLLIEATGRNQALVCADGPLLDKRLGALLDAVAARGVPVTAVLDCCHSGGASRDPLRSELTARYAPPSPGWDFADPAPVAREFTVTPPSGRHLLLAASRLDQPAYEGWFGGRRHGAFTHALIGAVRAAGAATTGRELLSAAAARVQRSGSAQQPVLFPDLPGGPADRPFPGTTGRAARGLAPHLLLRFGAQGWEVDCGSVHGLREGDGAVAQGTTFTVVDGGDHPAPAIASAPVLTARAVRTDRTLVTPVGWAPARDRVYPVALSALALPPGSVTLDGPPDVVRELTEAIESAPLLRLTDGPERAADLHFRVLLRDGTAKVLRRDGTPFTDPLPTGGPEAARQVADCLAHLTRWHQLRELTAPRSLLDGLVRVEIAPWDAAPGEVLLPDGSGEIVCPYTAGPDRTPQAPWVSIRLQNRSPDRTVWCLLLDLTGRYGSHSALYPGHFIGPGHTGHALDGDPVRLSLPDGRPAVPGAEARDWLKLIVAEGELNTLPFKLPDLDPGQGFHARLLGPVLEGGARRWTTLTVPLRTLVP